MMMSFRFMVFCQQTTKISGSIRKTVREMHGTMSRALRNTFLANIFEIPRTLVKITAINHNLIRKFCKISSPSCNFPMKKFPLQTI
jgi:hypothetical protein